MTMNNSLAEVHPELVSEWSEENLPLIPSAQMKKYGGRNSFQIAKTEAFSLKME